jgi:hypothetical protein
LLKFPGGTIERSIDQHAFAQINRLMYGKVFVQSLMLIKLMLETSAQLQQVIIKPGVN